MTFRLWRFFFYHQKSGYSQIKWACWLNKCLLPKNRSAGSSISTKSLLASVSGFFILKLNWSNHYHQFSMAITNVSNGHCQMSPSFHWSLLNPPGFFFCSTEISFPPIVRFSLGHSFDRSSSLWSHKSYSKSHNMSDKWWLWALQKAFVHSRE